MGCEIAHTACRPLPCKLERTALASISARCGAPTQRHASHSRSENAPPAPAASARNAGSIPVPKEGWTDVQDARAEGLAQGVSAVCSPRFGRQGSLPIWRNGGASASRSGGCEFGSLCGHFPIRLASCCDRPCDLLKVWRSGPPMLWLLRNRAVYTPGWVLHGLRTSAAGQVTQVSKKIRRPGIKPGTI